MAGNGFPPNPNSVNQKKNHAGTEYVDLERQEFEIPELPERYRRTTESGRLGSVKYLPETREWFEGWRQSPQARHITRTGWARLVMLAQLVDRYHRDPRKELLAEVRLNEAAFGATPADMARLRWNLREPTACTPAGDGSPDQRGSRHLTAVPQAPAS